jgi:muramidase (phage lysozyme)/uncharacterized integral membrane protein
MSDKYYVYRPLLDLIGKTEGTDRGDGYNETLAYGLLTNGDVDLVSMTLGEIDALQTKMLRHPKNRWKSSAVGRYQIVRTTLRSIKETLGLGDHEKFDADMQDRLACFLLGQRGIDKYLSGRLSENTLLLNLAKEWASLPTPEGKGYYDGQRAAVSVNEVRTVLGEVRKRHQEGQPVKQVVPPEIEDKVNEKSSLWQWLTGLIGSGSLGLGWLAGMNWDAIIAGGVVLIVIIAMFIVFNRQIIKAVRNVKDELA